MIDTHCHIFAEEFDEDRNEVIFRAKQAGISQILMPNIDVSTIQALKTTHFEYLDICLPMMGLHPCSVKQDYKEQLERMENELATHNYIGIGEIGLDYYWDSTFSQQQKDAFRIQLQWAKKSNMPVAIHTRNSFEDAIKIVKEESDENLKGVFHCFTGSVEDAQEIIKTGFYLGIGGVVTFKNGGMDKVLPEIGLDYLVLETDAPYLAPAPHRGKRNEPAYLELIAHKLATILNISEKEIADQTTKNAQSLFNLI